jgi:hypothetical protein
MRFLTPILASIIQNTGCVVNTTLLPIDVRTRKPLVTRDFSMAPADSRKQRIAADQVMNLKGKLQ